MHSDRAALFWATPINSNVCFFAGLLELGDTPGDKVITVTPAAAQDREHVGKLLVGAWLRFKMHSAIVKGRDWCPSSPGDAHRDSVARNDSAQKSARELCQNLWVSGECANTSNEPKSHARSAWPQ